MTTLYFKPLESDELIKAIRRRVLRRRIARGLAYLLPVAVLVGLTALGLWRVW